MQRVGEFVWRVIIRVLRRDQNSEGQKPNERQVVVGDGARLPPGLRECQQSCGLGNRPLPSAIFAAIDSDARLPPGEQGRGLGEGTQPPRKK